MMVTQKRFFIGICLFSMLWLWLPPEEKACSQSQQSAILKQENTKKETKKSNTTSTTQTTPQEKEMSRFVIHKHNARHLHFDLRLAYNGVLKSWAIPKGLSTKNNIKRLAIQVPDHPLSYINFEGEIEEGYGKGAVKIWDSGTYKNIRQDDEGKAIPFKKCLDDGVLDIEFFGETIKGRYTIVRTKLKQGKDPEWLVTKVKEKKSSF